MSESGGSEIDDFTAGRSIAVPLASVEKELSALWRQAAAAAKGAVTRACLWNLIVHAESDAGFQRAKKIIDDISPRLPARVLVLRAQRGAAPSPVQAWIEANWHGGGGSRQIGSEEVTLAASGPAVDDLASAVRALLVPDVPVAVLFTDGVPGEGALERELLRAADRVVLGDGSDAAAARILPRVSSHEAHAEAREITHLAWLQVAPWRQLLAGLFDPPTPPDELATVERVEITCAAGRRGLARALAAWLAARLGWREPREGSAGLRFAGPRGAIPIAVVEDPAATGPLARVALGCAGGEYEIVATAEGVVLNTPSLAWRHPLSAVEEGDLWIAALSAPGREPLYAEALRVLATMEG